MYAIRFFCTLLMTVVSAQVSALNFGAAGVPRDLAAPRDYAVLFQTLQDQGVDWFIPTFQYQEIPEAMSYGYELDFIPPCSAQDAAFTALMQSDVRLLIPAELIYPEGVSVVEASSSKDPLLELIECTGEEKIAAVVSYDEAIFNRIPVSQVQQLYTHVKSIRPEMPVMMVHAPIQDTLTGFERLWWRNMYRSLVRLYSNYADVIGFDVYPIPADIAQIAAISGRPECTGVCLVQDYALWLQQVFPDKERLMVLQGFSYPDLFDSDYLIEQLPADVIATIRPPNSTELQEMVDIIKMTETDNIIWWGQASLPLQTTQPWADIVEIMREMNAPHEIN